MLVKKPRKKQSLTSKIKSLKERNDTLYDLLTKRRVEINNLNTIISTYEELLPIKNYKIIYKVMTQGCGLMQKEEIIQSRHSLFLENQAKDKNCVDFEIIDIRKID